MPLPYYQTLKQGWVVRTGTQGSVYLYLPPCRIYPGSDFLSVVWFGFDNIHQLLRRMRCGVDQELQISLMGDMYGVLSFLTLQAGISEFPLRCQKGSYRLMRAQILCAVRL